MSGDYWLNRIGTAAAVTTPSGSIPQYGLAVDLGTAPWQDTQTFNTWVQDGVERTRRQDIARMEAAREQADMGTWQKIEDFGRDLLANITGSVQRAGAAVAGQDSYQRYQDQGGTGSRDEWEGMGRVEQNLAMGTEALGVVAEAPGIKQLGQVWNFSSALIETPLIMDRNAGLRGNLSLWLDGSEWAAAWREAEERTIGEAVLDSILTGIGVADSEKDLDRMRRTNSLYGLTTFAGDLYVGFKFDPTVGAAKGIGEAKRIRIGAMPRGQTSRIAAATARRAAWDPKNYRYTGSNPMGHYGAWRGRRVVAGFDDLRQKALDLTFAEFSELSMFRQRSVNGPQAAMAMQIAAKDDALWDLTKRAVMGDPTAWRQIEQMKHDPLELKEFAPGAATFIDAIEATKTKMAQLQSEVDDLQKTIAKREEFGPQSPTKGRRGRGINEGFFEHHTWELHRDLEDKLADITRADQKLAGYEDYGTWLEKIKDDGVWAHVDQVSTGDVPGMFDMMRSNTYQKSLFGVPHTVSQVTKAGWIKQANPIDLHRVESGTMSIRRQFIQFKHLFGYENIEAYDDLLTRFVKAKDPLERFKIAKEVEDVHLVSAIAAHHGLDPQTIDTFLGATRLRKNEMANALLSGNGAVYTTVPNSLDSARLIRIKDGMAEVELMDNGRRRTLRVPEEALHTHADMPVDVTQTPNYYTPMDTRQVALAVKRNSEFFELLDGDIKAGMRRTAAKVMEDVDKYGTFFNSLWKPLQLFRLAWPQRVLMDEGLRAMAVLGVTDWSRTFIPAMTTASVNAFNPALHGTFTGMMGGLAGAAVGTMAAGPYGGLAGFAGGAALGAKLSPSAFIKRRHMKIGPGPVADQISGRGVRDVEPGESAPFLPSFLSPRPDANRTFLVTDFVQGSTRARALRNKTRALLRNPNSRQSLPQGARTPANWLRIEDILDGTSRRQQQLAGRGVTITTRRPKVRNGPDVTAAPEDFTVDDFIYATMVQRELTDDDMLNALTDSPLASDEARIQAFLELEPSEKLALWEGDSILLAERFPEFASPDLLPDLRNVAADDLGRLRYAMRKRIADGRKEFDREVTRRKRGANAGPLFNGEFIDIASPQARLEMMIARELGAEYIPVDRWLSDFADSNVRRAVNRRDLDAGAQRLVPRNILNRFVTMRDDATRKLVLFDPFNNKVTRQGYAVRVDTADVPFLNYTDQLPGDAVEVIEDLFARNAEFLGAKGYRLMLEGKRLSVVRYFRSNERDRAIEFARHIDADSFYKLGDLGKVTEGGNKGKVGPGHEVYIRDWNDRSPIMEQLDRQFQQGSAWEARRSHKSPAVMDGKQIGAAYHATQSETGLPEQLLPRQDTPIANGNMYGPAFYTTLDLDYAAESGFSGYNKPPRGTDEWFEYMARHIYTVVNTRSGKKAKVWNLQRQISDKQRELLLRELDAWADDLGLNGPDLDDLRTAVRRSDNWTQLYETLDMEGYASSWNRFYNGYDAREARRYDAHEFLATHLERNYNVGALFQPHYNLGRIHGAYMWLHPEDLIIEPAYAKGKSYLLEDWFLNPQSREELFNRVPENRIIRTGNRDPRFAELEQVHRKRMEREAEVMRRREKEGPNAPYIWDDPVHQALLGREQSLMAKLGVEYTHNVQGSKRFADTTPDEGNWWTQIDPGRIAREKAEARLAERAAGDLRRAETQEVDAVADGFDMRQADSTHETFLRRLARRREFGKGYSKWTTSDGKDAVVQNFLEGEGEVYVPLISAAPTYARLTDTYKRTLSKYREKAVGYKRIAPPDVSPAALRTQAGKVQAMEYYSAWADLLNDQIRNSPIWYRMLAGESDEAILNWLMKTDEGARIRRQLPHKGRHPERWIQEHREALNFYLPDVRLQGLLRDGRIMASDLRRVPQRDLPEIFGPELEMVAGEKGFGKEIAQLSERIYRALGTVPTDLLSRQPFAKAMYDLKMRNLIRASDSEWLTPEILKDYEKLSREFAIRQLRRTLFDLTDETNMTQALRFIAPFWGAQSEAIIKWMGIAVERPETIARFHVGLNAVYNNMIVVDEENRPVDGIPSIYNANHRMIIQIPERLKKMPFFDKALKDFGTVGVAFASANTALQGDMPIIPSLGPMVTVPADKMVNAMWDTHGTHFDDNFFYRWLFPVGRPSGGVTGTLEQIFPGWGRRMLAMQAGQDSTMYANTWFSVQREMYLRAKEKGQPPPSPEEVERAVKWHFALRVVAAFAAPAAMEFRPKNQFFLDQYHEMQRTYGPSQAFEKFLEEYGESAAQYAASSSSGLVPPTAKGMEEWSKNKDLVRQVSAMGYSDLASAIVSPDAWADDFSSDSYREQFEIAVGPGSKQKLRESQDPLARIVSTDRRVGWVQYRQFMSAINAELYARGLTSLEQSGAEDLAETKAAWVAQLEERNQAWSQDYRTYSDTIYQQVEVLRNFAFEPRFDSRPDIQGLRQFLMLRDAAAQSLDAWAAQGGSRSLQSQENTDLRNWYYDQVGQLIQANPSFGEFYTRFLDADRLERGSGP